MDPGSSLIPSSDAAHETEEDSQDTLDLAQKAQEYHSGVEEANFGTDTTSCFAYTVRHPLRADPCDTLEVSQPQSQPEQEPTTEGDGRRLQALLSELTIFHNASRTAAGGSTNEAARPDDNSQSAPPVDIAAAGALLAEVDIALKDEVRSTLNLIRDLLQQVRQAVLTEDEEKRVRFSLAEQVFTKPDALTSCTQQMPLKVATDVFNTMIRWLELHVGRCFKSASTIADPRSPLTHSCAALRRGG